MEDMDKQPKPWEKLSKLLILNLVNRSSRVMACLQLDRQLQKDIVSYLKLKLQPVLTHVLTLQQKKTNLNSRLLITTTEA